MEIKNGQKPGAPNVKPIDRAARKGSGSVQSSGRPSATTQAASSTQNVSKVALSSGQQEVGRILALLSDVPEVDLDRVHQLKKEVESGKYSPDSKVTADRIIEETLLFGAVEGT